MLSLLLVSLIFLDVQTARIDAWNQNETIRGRLLTPEEGCGISPKFTSPRIVGGHTAPNGAFPWMAMIGYTYDTEKIRDLNCGGTLITSRHVLTAAHCMKANIGRAVRLGEHDISSLPDKNDNDYKIIKADIHPGFDGYINDIAILTLDRDVKFSSKIRPICLPINEPERSSKFENTKPHAAGWGRLQEEGPLPSVLQMVQLPVIDNKSCKESWEKVGPVRAELFSNISICAGYFEGGKAGCYSDDGGPLMLPISKNGEYPFYQIGIHHWNVGCARKHLPAVYARITTYIDWIQEIIGQN